MVILRMLAADFLVFSTILSAAWCNDISVPKTLNATSGSCLLIPCQFEISTENEKYLDLSPVVTWRRGSLWSFYDTERFTNAHRQTEPLMKVVGDLRNKNCTSVLMNLTSQHSDRYFFKFSSKGFSINANKAVLIRVSDSLAEPYVIVPELREGEVGNLTCTVPAPCPSNSPNVTWDPALGGNITQWTQLNADGTQNVSAILNFIPLFHHHELKVNCVSINLLDRQGKPLLSYKTVILNVEYPPKETHISLTGSVVLGNVTLTCQSNANPPAVHRWFMKKEGIVVVVGASRVLSFTVTHNNSGEYICEAQNLHGAGNSTILQINLPGQSVLETVEQGSPNPAQEGYCPAEFSLEPNQAHLPAIFLVTLKTSAVSKFRGCVLQRLHSKAIALPRRHKGCPNPKAPSDVASKCVLRFP